MALQQAFADARAIVGLLGMIPIMIGAVAITANIGQMDTTTAVEAFTNLTAKAVYAQVPSVGGIMLTGIVLALLLLIRSGR